MSDADCSVCAAAGYRACDECGNPVFPDGAGFGRPAGVDLCANCDVEVGA